MSNLYQTQDKFLKYLLDGDNAIQQAVVGTDKVPVETRLAIYAEAYRSRLIEALESSYPALLSYLGSDEFEKLGLEYLTQYPSTYRSIRWFGDQLPEFLNEHPHYQQFAYLSELAQVEWITSLVFDAADDTVLQLEQMASIPPHAWTNMRLKAHPSTYRINLSYNVMEIWQDLIDDKIPPDPLFSDTPTFWVLWRHQLINQYTALSEDEAWAIDAMLEGLSFAEICEGLCQWVDEQNAPLHAASLLKGWIIAGIISSTSIY